jgi:hypothetical protein|tara:strand:- start:4 stop:270 length:267 start_codon:yes stop_codon:yes gene_type:complete
MKGGYRLNSKSKSRTRRARRRRSRAKGRGKGKKKGRKTRQRRTRKQNGGGVGILASLKSLLAPGLLLFAQKKVQNRKTARKTMKLRKK